MPEPVFFDQCELLTRADGSLVELGSGGTSTAYKGFDTRLQVPVALKIIHSDGLATEGARQRFVAAAQQASRLRHRHIASIFGFGEEEGNCFFTMEFVEGESLDAVLRREGNLSVDRALEIVVQVTSALRGAALHKIVHSDLRPAKLMLAHDDEEVKILDYGLAVRSFSGGAPGTTGADGKPAGLSDYASPEQLEGREIDVRSDIYSLGLILWQMVTGEKIGQPLPDRLPLEKLGTLAEPVVQLLNRMLERDPARRPQTPGELQAEIDRCFDSLAGATTIIPEPAPPSPKQTPASVPLDEMAEESAARAPAEEPQAEPLAEPPIEPPPTFSDTDAEALESKSYVVPEPGAAWQTRRAGRSWLRTTAALALLATILAIGFFGYDYHRRHATAETGQITALEPNPPPPPVSVSTPVPEPIQHLAPAPVAKSLVEQAQGFEQQQKWPESLDTWLQVLRDDPKSEPGRAGINWALHHLFEPARAFSQEPFESLRNQIAEAARLGVPAAKALLEVDQIVVSADEAEKKGQWSVALLKHQILADKYAPFGFGPPDWEEFFGRMNDHLAEIPDAMSDAMRVEITKHAQQGVAAAAKILTGQLMSGVETARKLEADQKWHDALAIWLRQAKADARALPQLKLCLGSISNLTPGLTPKEFAAMQRDITEAAQLFDIGPAQFLLGDQLQKKNPPAAFAWYCAAARNGERMAMLRAGQMLKAGNGTLPDPVKAAAYVNMAAEQGDPNAMTTLAQYYQDGIGVSRDPKRAVGLLKQASDGGYLDATTLLGDCYHRGLGVERDDNAAFVLFSEAAKKNDPIAAFNLGVLLSSDDIVCKQGEQRNFPQDLRMAEAKFTQAFQQFKDDTDKGIGGSTFLYFRAYCYEWGAGCAKDLKAAREWYQKAAAAGDARAADWCKRSRVQF